MTTAAMFRGTGETSTRGRTLAVALALVGALVASLAGVAGADERIVTRAEAFVEVDGRRDFDQTFEIHDLNSGIVDAGNVATAHARRCTGCQAVALSFQVVLVQQPAEVVVPENLAVSLNEECTGCDAAAGAYQFVVGRGEPIRLTPSGHEQLARVRGEVARLQGAMLSGPETLARAGQLADKVRAILVEEVHPVDEWVEILIEDRRSRQTHDGPTQESITTVATAA